MQIMNNSQPSFRGLGFKKICSVSYEKEVKEILYSKLPKSEADSFIKTLSKSPVTTILGLADGKATDRLNAIVYYKNPLGATESFDYFEESKLRNLFNIKPRNFINKVLLDVESVEETFCIGRYA